MNEKYSITQDFHDHGLTKSTYDITQLYKVYNNRVLWYKSNDENKVKEEE